jgi:hypothetical protein
MLVRIRKLFVVPGTDDKVKCVTFACGHERILSTSDFRQLSFSGDRAECVECRRQAEAA